MLSVLKARLATLLHAQGLSISRRRAPEAEALYALTVLKQYGAKNGILAAFADRCLTNYGISQAQLFQDVLADFVMGGKPGVFCEFGATDGQTLSNTAMLEAHRGWTGVLAEPSHQWHDTLRANRPAALIDTRCVYGTTGESVAFSEAVVGEFSGMSKYRPPAHGHRRNGAKSYMVRTVSLNDLLDEHGLAAIDYLSVDTEGSELAILQAFDFARFRPQLITVEHGHLAHRRDLFDLITSNGYRRILEEVSEFDDWYVRADHPLGSR